MNESWKTAIHRVRPSMPCRFLKKLGLLKGDILDYGCGYGFDTKYLQEFGFNCYAYDKFYHPELEITQFDTIMCNYVLNVIDRHEELLVLGLLADLLRVGGTAYIAVRNDVRGIKFDKKRVTMQREVILDLPVLFTNRFCKIYYLEK